MKSDLFVTGCGIHLTPGGEHAILFVLLWRRRKNYLAWLWEYDQKDIRKGIRYEFETDVSKLWKSKLTGLVTDSTSMNTRVFRMILTTVSLLAWVLLIIMIMICSLICKYQLSAEFQRINKTWSIYLGVITITFINVIVMDILQKFTRKLAYHLTRIENHKTYHSFETAFITKLYGFGFTCNFSTFTTFYFLNVLYTYPSDENRWYLIGGIGMMNCGSESCLDELCVSLVTNILFQYYIRHLPAWLVRTKSDYTSGRHNLPCWEREYLLKPLTEYDLIRKFNSLVMTFTLLGIFGSVFPLTSLLLLISCICYIRYEARRFLVGSRRPLLRQPSSQDVWYKIMFAVVYAVPCFNTMAMTLSTTTVQYHETRNLSTSIMFSMGTFVTKDYKTVTGPGSPAEALSNYKGFVPAECLFPGFWLRSKNGNYYYSERFWRTRYDKHRLMLDVEHLALLIMIMLHFVIPSYPRDVKDTIATEKGIKRRARLKGKIN